MAKRSKRKPNVIGTKAVLAKLDRMMPILERNITGALIIEATLETGNDTVKAMPDRHIPGANAYNVIRWSLAFDLAMHLARLFDKGSRRYHPNDKDAASIPLMIRLLRQKRCRRGLAKRARYAGTHGSPDSHFGDLFERDCLAAIERASRAYTATFRGRFGQSGLRRLKEARDQHLAHSISGDRQLKLIYNQLFRLTDCARDILEAANVAVVGRSLELAEVEGYHREQATEFWTRALLGIVADEETAA